MLANILLRIWCGSGQLELVSSGQCVTASDELLDATVSKCYTDAWLPCVFVQCDWLYSAWPKSFLCNECGCAGRCISCAAVHDMSEQQHIRHVCMVSVFLSMTISRAYQPEPIFPGAQPAINDHHQQPLVQCGHPCVPGFVWCGDPRYQLVLTINNSLCTCMPFNDCFVDEY